MDGSRSFHWQRGLLCGLLWCIAVSLIDILTQPSGNWSRSDVVSFAARAFLASLAGGLVWSLGAEWSVNRRRKLAMFGVQLPIAVVAFVAGAHAPIEGLFKYSGDIGRLMSHMPLIDFTCYAVWINGLYGGIYILGFHATNRTIQLRQHLTELRLASGEADMRLREMRLRAYQGQISPPTILEALEELQRRYLSDRSAGDQLFDRLVDFLRAAMPGLRTSASTLSAELAIIKSYAMLRNALCADCRRWQLDLSSQQQDTVLSFIPLRLLASLDRIDRCVPPGQTIKIKTECRGETFGVNVRTHTPGLGIEERQCLKVDLETALDGDAVVMAQTSGHLSLDLRLPSRSVN